MASKDPGFPVDFPVNNRRKIDKILDETRFNRDRKYLSNKNRKNDRLKDKISVAICGLRDPRDGLKRVNFVSKNEPIKVVKCFDIGIGANRIGDKVQAVSLTLKGRGFIDYRG